MKRFIKLEEILGEVKKPYLTLNDLSLFFKYKDKDSLKVAVSRLVNDGFLVRMTKNIYRLYNQYPQIETIATHLYIPCYLSLEKAIGDSGILNQKAYTYTFVTTRKTKKMVIENQAVEFSQIAPELYFGFFDAGGFYLAYPEKAFLDQLYFVSRGTRSLDFDELNLKLLQKKRLFSFLKKFPKRVKDLFEKKARPILDDISVTIK